MPLKKAGPGLTPILMQKSEVLNTDSGNHAQESPNDANK